MLVIRVCVLQHIYIHVCRHINADLYMTNQLSLFIIAVIGKSIFFLCLHSKKKKNPYIIVSCHVVQDASTQVNEKNA